jgi:phosphate:Na+ symporter
MDIAAALVGGLGLFFVGLRQLSAQLQAVAGRRMRQAVAAATRGPWTAGALGLALGALTQSSNAVAFIAASLRAADAMEPRRALPLVAWANAGTAVLVFVASLDLRIAAFWVLGLAGFATYFGRARLRAAAGVATALGLVLLGLGLMKSGAAPLREMEAVRGLLLLSGGGLLAPLLCGLGFGLVAQSASAIAILALTLHEARLLSLDQAAVAVIGASAGSGLAVWLMAREVSGTARQPLVFQACLRLLGAAAFAAAAFAEARLGAPVLGGWALTAAVPDQFRLALLFLALQAMPAALAAPLHRPIQRLLDARVPPSPAEAFSRPRHFFPGAAEQADTALDLVAKEQARLVAALPTLLDAVREDAVPDPMAPSPAAMAELEAAIRGFTDTVLERAGSSEAAPRGRALEARLAWLASLREAVAELAALPGGPPPAMAEALHLLLEELREAADAEALGWLLDIASDRGEMMARLRRQAAEAGDAERMFRATAVFERAVWLVRRVASLDLESLRA